MGFVQVTTQLLVAILLILDNQLGAGDFSAKSIIACLHFVKLIAKISMLADQFFLGAFGSTMPLALACERPAMLFLNYETHEWCFDEPPPVVSARTDEEVFDGLCRIHGDRDWTQQLVVDGLRWYDTYHSNWKIASIRAMAG